MISNFHFNFGGVALSDLVSMKKDQPIQMKSENESAILTILFLNGFDDNFDVLSFGDFILSCKLFVRRSFETFHVVAPIQFAIQIRYMWHCIRGPHLFL
jgi:hypothetical protein